MVQRKSTKCGAATEGRLDFLVPHLELFYLILAIVFVLFSVIVFAALFANTAAFWISYAFAVVALALQVYAWPKAFDFEGHDVKSRFYGFPIARLGIYYLVIQLAVSIIEIALSKYLPTWVVIIINVLFLAVAQIGRAHV